MSVPPPTSELTANEILLDSAVMHAIHLERLKSGEVRKIIALLNDKVIPELLGRLQFLDGVASRGSDVGLHSQEQLKALKARLDEIVREGMHLLHGDLKGDLGDLSVTESKWQLDLLRAASDAPAIGIDFLAPSVGLLRSIVTERPFAGALLKDWFAELARRTQANVKKAINIGLVNGESVDKIMARLRGTRAAGYSDGVLNGTRREIESVVRTSINHVVTQAREDTYKANGDLIKGVQWRSTLDIRTTLICIDLDGHLFAIGEGPRPPAHFGCRSKTVPVLKSWKELGLNLKELPPGTRASMDGQVPETLTYGDWLKRQSVERQNEVLGPARAALFRSGKITIDQFVDDRGKTLTLQQLSEIAA